MNNELRQFEYKRYADIKRLKYIERELSKTIKPGGRVLDVGCGNGVISRYLGFLNYNVTGIDADAKAIDRARALNDRMNVTFFLKSAEELKAENAKYDAIICSEVLEHLEYPVTLLHTLNKSLKDEGVLIVTVPNGIGPRELLVTRPMIYIRSRLPFLWTQISHVKRFLGYSGRTVQSDSDNLDHIQFFTISELRRLAEKSSFCIKEIRSSNFIDDVFPFSMVTRFSQKLQRMDAALADILPVSLTGGFFSVWEKNAVVRFQ